MYITSEAELKAFIFRRLGSEKHNVEISDDNWSDIYNTNIKYLKEYSSDVVYEKYYLVDIGENTELTLDDNCLSVNFIKEKGVGSELSIDYTIASPFYDFMMYGDYEIGSIYTFRDDIKEIKKVIAKPVKYDFSTSSKQLRILEDLEETELFLNVTMAEDVDTFYNEHFFHLLLERDCWKYWISNSSKYRGSKIGNDIELNVEYFKEKYQELKEEIKEAQENEEFDMLRPIKLIPR